MQREFAVASFSGWINTPQIPNASSFAVFIALSRAVARTKVTSSTPPDAWTRSVFDPAYNLSAGLKGSIALPDFWALDEHTRYNDCRYAADVVRFLLTYKNGKDDRRTKASLGKASVYLNKHGGFVRGNYDRNHFGEIRSYWCSSTEHHKRWRWFKQSACFQFVRFYLSKLNWYLDPRSDDFLDQLAGVANCPDELATFFRMALDVQLRLRDVIDVRSMSEGDYFRFPEDLTPQRCRLPAMPPSAYGFMASYKRSASAYDMDWAEES